MEHGRSPCNYRSGKEARRTGGRNKKAEQVAISYKDQNRHVDAALREFGYGGNPADIAPVCRSHRLFKRNELKRMLFDFYRQHGNGKSDNEIAVYVCEQKGWDANAYLLDKVTASVKLARRAVERG
jgi:hypothetical protein